MPQFILKSFIDLTARELHLIYYLRAQVFVVEQNCAYQDVDETDLICFHLQLIDAGQLLGYARIIAPNSTHNYSKIGRVVTAPNARGKALGKALMNEAITICKTQFMQKDIVISAQQYLLKFYTELGFYAEGEGYLEDDIPHIQMRLSS